jgi:hypothetical protein
MAPKKLPPRREILKFAAFMAMLVTTTACQGFTKKYLIICHFLQQICQIFV